MFGMHKHLKDHGGSLAASHMKEVISVGVGVGHNLGGKMPEKLFIEIAGKLPLGVPVQVQFEIIPVVANGYTVAENGPTTHEYIANIVSVKARLKPGTVAFFEEEEKSLNHIINGTEDTAQIKIRAEKNAKKIAKTGEEANRFTGLEI